MAESVVVALKRDAEALGLSGAELTAYVLEEKRRIAEQEREDRILARDAEIKRKEAEVELKKIEAAAEKAKHDKEIELKRLEAEEAKHRLEAEEAKHRGDREFELRKIEIAAREKEQERQAQEREQERLQIGQREAEERLATAGEVDNEGQRIDRRADNSAYIARNVFGNMDKYKSSVEEIDSFLYRFEQKCEMYHIEGTLKATSFMDLMTGDALETIRRLSHEEMKDYELIKKAMLLRFGLSPEKFKEKFDAAMMDKGETMQQFLTRIKGYYLRWIESAKIEQTFEGLSNEYIKLKIFSSVSNPLQTYLRERERDYTDLVGMAELADHYIIAHANQRVGKSFAVRHDIQYNQFKGFNSFKGNVNNGASVNNFKGPHMQSKDDAGHTEDSQITYKRTNQVKCMICNRVGHEAKDCYHKPNLNTETRPKQIISRGDTASGSNVRGCWSCGDMSHRQYECPRRARVSQLAMVIEDPLRVDGSSVNMNSDESRETVSRGNVLEHSSSIAAVDRSSAERPFTAQLVAPTDCRDDLIWCEGTIGGENNRIVSVIRDTGCSGLMVKRRLVRDNELTGKYFNCILADGTIRSCAEAILDLKTPYFCGRTKALCLENPVYDILVGNIPGAVLIPNVKGDCWRIDGKVEEEIRRASELEVLPQRSITVEEVQDRECTVNDCTKIVEGDTLECSVVTRGMEARETRNNKPLKVSQVEIFTDVDMEQEQIADRTLEKFFKIS